MNNYNFFLLWYNISKVIIMKKVKSPAYVYIFLFVYIVGLAILAGGIAFGVMGINYKKNGTEVNATITKIVVRGSDNDSHDVYVSYEYEGVAYTNKRINTYMSSWEVGKEIKLYVMPYDPSKPKSVVGYKIANIVLTSIGIFYTSVMMILIIITFKKTKESRLLLETGTKVSATITEICTDTKITVNGRHPYKYLNCSIDGKIYKSKSFKNLNVNIGDYVTVFLGLNDKYYVDIDSIKEEQSKQEEPILKNDIVFTAFEPFGGRDTNASLEVVKKMGYEYVMLPVSWDLVPNKVDQILLNDPKLVILCGEAAKYENVRIETIAHNICNGTDNYGVTRVEELIKYDAPEILGTNVNASFDDINTDIGDDAGKYLCNYVYYLMLSKAKNTKVIFIHYPLIKEQGGNKELNDLVKVTKDIVKNIKIGE